LLHSMTEVVSETFKLSLMILLQDSLTSQNPLLVLLTYLKELWLNLQNQNNHLNFKLKLLENIKLLCAVAVMEPIQLQEDQARLFWEQMLI